MGYHAHNNFQMGYANCITMMSQKTERMLLVDGTIYGMGKSAGNAPIELIAMYMNENLGKNYHISQFLEAIDSNIMDFILRQHGDIICFSIWQLLMTVIQVMCLI